MQTPTKKRSWKAILWLIVGLVFAGMFVVDHWIRRDATPFYSFGCGAAFGAAMLQAVRARRRSR